jgi:hypothetical protein
VGDQGGGLGERERLVDLYRRDAADGRERVRGDDRRAVQLGVGEIDEVSCSCLIVGGAGPARNPGPDGVRELGEGDRDPQLDRFVSGQAATASASVVL